MTRDEKALRAAIIAKARWMNASGLNQGTSGNISARSNHVMLITPDGRNRLNCEGLERGPAEMAGLQRLGQRVIGDHGAARHIYEDCAPRMAANSARD